HELGHIKWWKNDVEKINKNSRDCRDDITKQYTQFADITWTQHNAGSPKWRYFATEDSNNGNKPYGGVGRKKLYDDIINNPTNVINDLRVIFNGSWPSIFSTVAPDEDYVETYTMIAVLQTMFKTINPDLKVTLTDGTLLTDIADDYLSSTDSNR